VFHFLDPGWIRSADPGGFSFTLAVISGLSLLALWYAGRSSLQLRAIAAIPSSLIRSAAQGYVRLDGKARLLSGDPIVAPLSCMRCTWWSYRIEGPSGQRRGSWETISADTSDGIFLIEDGSGQCVVDPDGARVYPSARDVWYGATPEPVGGPRMGGSGRYRYTELRVDEGAPLYAQGYFHTQGPVGAGDIDEEVRSQLAEWKRHQATLVARFDANHDGQVDLQEWEAARAEARRVVLEQEREAMTRPPVNVLGKPRDGRAFVLSTVPHDKLLSRLHLQLWVSLAAFVATGAAAVNMLHVRLG
jgi:hypothetical protein